MDRRKGQLSFWGRLASAILLAAGLWAATGCDRLAPKEQAEEAPPQAQEPVVEPAAPPSPRVVGALEAIDGPVSIEMPDPEAASGFVLNTRSQVALLCYHDFTTGKSSNDMRINIDKFRAQMQALKDGGIPVISFSEFLRWKRGEANIPDFAVVITIDDGWREVYTLAYPVFKEFGYPFTLFLYTKFLDGGGRTLKVKEVKEMMANGAEVGSHSVSHLDMTQRNRMSDEGYHDFLVRELKDSREGLKATFGNVLDVFSYPYGIYSQQILDLAFEHGYEAMVTVDGRKALHNTADGEIGRYVVHSNDDRNFKFALTLRGDSSLADGNNLLAPSAAAASEGPLVTTVPADDSTIDNRLPLIVVDLSRLEGIDPASIEMRISGLGRVPARFDAVTGRLTYQINQRLRAERCSVRVKLQRAGAEAPDVVAWSFSLDRTGHYLSGEGESRMPASGAPAPVARPVPKATAAAAPPGS